MHNLVKNLRWVILHYVYNLQKKEENIKFFLVADEILFPPSLEIPVDILVKEAIFSLP